MTCLQLDRIVIERRVPFCLFPDSCLIPTLTSVTQKGYLHIGHKR